MTKYYIVWNEDKSEGFVTNDSGLAYEVRKSADTNCYRQDGKSADVAKAFCDVWSNDNCTIEEMEIK